MEADGTSVKFIVILVASQFERCLGRIDDIPRMLCLCSLQFSVYIYLEILSIICAHHMVPELILKIRGALQVSQSLVPFAGESERKLSVHITQQPSAFIVSIILNNSCNPSPTHTGSRTYPSLHGNGFLRHLHCIIIIGHPSATICAFELQLA